MYKEEVNTQTLKIHKYKCSVGSVPLENPETLPVQPPDLLRAACTLPAESIQVPMASGSTGLDPSLQTAQTLLSRNGFELTFHNKGRF